MPPDIPLGAELAYSAFSDLSGDRQMGMGIGPISWVAMNEWAVRFGLDDIDEFVRLVVLVRAMDGVYLRLVAKAG